MIDGLVGENSELNHSACGVGLIVNMNQKPTHKLVQDGLKVLTNFEYRAGYNLITDESDGSGIRFYGFSAEFFINKAKQGQFITSDNKLLCSLQQNQFTVGQFFLPTDPEQLNQTKKLIAQCAKEQNLLIIGWRDLNPHVSNSILSAKALEKKPSLWQAVLIQDQAIQTEIKLEQASLKMALVLSYAARKNKLNLNIVSLSSESIVYKGMVPAYQLQDFYHDLSDKEFTACATTLHSRFATNTDPQWPNAQPCVFYISHNGEFNSALANATEMSNELNYHQFQGIYPNEKLSDSMQFDADLANQMILKNISLEEAVVRLLAPPNSDNYSPAINAMLKYWQIQRTPYNGPAFVVGGSQGHYFAKLDSIGLRPSRWALVKDAEGTEQFYAASDDFLTPQTHTLIKKGQLQPGAMLLLNPEGKLLDTHAVLEQINTKYPSQHFEQNIDKILLPMSTADSLKRLTTQSNASLNQVIAHNTLQRILYAAGWDFETEDQVVRYMAEFGVEKTGAMGNDTNPLHSTGMPAHIAYFFHQLFAQVSSPPIDSIKERDRFSLTMYLGSMPMGSEKAQLMELDSPILNYGDLDIIELHPSIPIHCIDTSFFLRNDSDNNLSDAIKQLLIQAKNAAEQGGILILSDRKVVQERVLIPDLIAVAAVRRYLEQMHLSHKVAIVCDSYQISGPHHASTLIALGAQAIYPRGAYAKICNLFPRAPASYTYNYKTALEKCLLKTMGKVGITDIKNFCNGQLVAALGLDLSPPTSPIINEPSLGAIFAGIYSPLKGIQLKHIANSIVTRHQQAYSLEYDFEILPRSGFYMPEKKGIKHGYGPEIINAFTEWMKTEDLQAKLHQMHIILEKKGYPNFLRSNEIPTINDGYLDPRKKNAAGFYPPEYLRDFSPSRAFRKFSKEANQYRIANPTCLRDYFKIKEIRTSGTWYNFQQTQESIRALLFSGSMSQGALTVSNPDTPNQLGAHEALTRGMNAVGAKSASGEGGEDRWDVRDYLKTTRSKQIASGRFGVNAIQIINAEEIEIKVAQGAKPGEGGEVPGYKVHIRFAAQRGGLPFVPYVSPPPHHDIYSIEDLKQLIHDIKTVKPNILVAVKLVSSLGIGTIACGVAKAGADVINIGSDSGGTGAAQQSSIKHAGLPAEIGLAEVDRALRSSGFRDLVKLRVSGGFKTAEDVLIIAILGADQFEFGTTAMLTLGCKMMRTCNHSCKPGVATDGHLFKGDQINTERYFVNLAAAIQIHLQKLGFQDLRDIRGRTDLLELTNYRLDYLYDFSVLLDRSKLPKPLHVNRLLQIKTIIQTTLMRPKEDALISTIKDAKDWHIFNSKPIELSTQDLSFGARLAGTFANVLENNPQQQIVVHTNGNAGQSFGFVLCKGLKLVHTGTVQDGCGKSMSGGELIIRTPNSSKDYPAHENTVAGNAMLYGASGGCIYVNGRAGHRFGILLKGAEVVVEGVGDLAFEYMTSGTGMILGKAGTGLGAGALAGIIIVYNKNNNLNFANSVRKATGIESEAYNNAIQQMLKKHSEATGSALAHTLLTDFDPNHFTVLIPKELDKIKTLSAVVAIIKTYQKREAPLTSGMQVWLEQKTLAVLATANPKSSEYSEFYTLIRSHHHAVFSAKIHAKLMSLTRRQNQAEHFDIPNKQLASTANEVSFWPKPKQQNPIEKRIHSISGALDDVLLNALEHIQSYVNELTHDGEGCSGCRAQSCAGGDKVDSGCPSGKGINTINSLLKRMGGLNESGILTAEQWRLLRQAFAVQIQESPFIAYTGAACPAPCQDACTETIPTVTGAKHSGKLVGEPVHIKDIEYYLYQIGRALAWFDGNKNWTTAEIAIVFGDLEYKQKSYDRIMQEFSPPFQVARSNKNAGYELIIVGSGPAGMQMAYQALRDGLTVRMYERSDKPGGLLADGIPAHKFDKTYLAEDFKHLINMGLKLYLKSEVYFDETSQSYCISANNTNQTIAQPNNNKQFVALCLGAGAPKSLPDYIFDSRSRYRCIQALNFLKAANDVANLLKVKSYINYEEKEKILRDHFGIMDPRGKKILVVGGGDTAVDVIRWLTRYFSDEPGSLGELNILVRGPELKKRAVLDSYPSPSRVPIHENELKQAEVEYVHGTSSHLVEPISITTESNGKLKIIVKESKFKYYEFINQDEELRTLAEQLPRELRPIDTYSSENHEFSDIDLVICALGFQGNSSIPLINDVAELQLPNVVIAGDAAGVEQKIIVGAQASAKNTYEQIQALMGIRTSIASVKAHSLFVSSSERDTGRHFVTPGYS
ncbi:MAG: glutamate synthase-related protein [Legionella sp.]|jgi:glutamate synthase domain-containing protein 2/glutamate synthase domain-containing protein 3/glutamate synthase domain-containing protein 1/NADPH-dependent glutamate synthase beta subunit-like oxidoreductase